MQSERPQPASSPIPPDLERPRTYDPGVAVAMSWAVGLCSMAYLLSMVLVGRVDGAFWVDLPLLLLFASWCMLVAIGRSSLAAQFVGWAGLVVIFAIAAVSGGTWSPALMLALVLLSYVECYLDRASTMRIVGACLAGLVGLGTLEAMGLLPAPRYTHSSVERALITGVSVILTAVLLVGRWDERSRTLTQLRRSTESLRAVNAVLYSTRTEAVARARQQQVLARLTVDAFSLASTVKGMESPELRMLLARCCAVTFSEVGDGWISLRQHNTAAPVLVEYGQPSGSKGSSMFAGRWPVHVLGKQWGELVVECRGPSGEAAVFSANDRLFVDGIVSLISAAMSRVATASALREKETLLRKAQRFESVAYKASGVVHDLNNALACILQNAELAREQVEEGGDVLEELDGIVEAVMGATSISRHLLRSTQSPETTLVQRASLSKIVREALRSQGAAFGRNIRLDCDIADFDGWVPLFPGSARQVLMNLVVNARQAMPDGGCLQVELGQCLREGGAPEVSLRVSDSGYGIPRHLLGKIFQPLFTTKQHMGGTGIGLATVHSIVTEAGGRIEVQSVEGEGTTFVIHLPMLDAAADERRADSTGRWTGGGATILVVHDEEQVRTATLRTLARFGYRVLEAETREEALEMVRVHGCDVDLLVTDTTRDGLDARALVHSVRDSGGRVPVVMVTDPADLDSERLGDTCMLVKPVTSEALVATIEGLLASGQERQHGTDWLQTG